MSSTRQVCRTQAEAAVALGISRRTLCDWLAKGCPGGNASYDIDVIEEWRARNLKPRQLHTGQMHDCVFSGCYLTGRPILHDEGYEAEAHQSRRVQAVFRKTVEDLRDRVGKRLSPRQAKQVRQAIDLELNHACDLFLAAHGHCQCGDSYALAKVFEEGTVGAWGHHCELPTVTFQDVVEHFSAPTAEA